MIFVPNYWVRLFMFVLMGLAQLKTNVCYSWLFSLVHSSNKASVCSFLNAFDTITLAVSCFYFQFISREWYGLYLTMTIIGTISYFILVLVIPESPRWLLVQGREQDAIKAFNTIAKLNFSKNRIPLQAQFAETLI
jgi:hypothetical protein